MGGEEFSEDDFFFFFFEREKEKKRERYRERDRDREREKERERDRERDRDRDRDRDTERERERAFNGLSVYDTTAFNEHLFWFMLGPVTNFWMGQDWGGVSQFI